MPKWKRWILRHVIGEFEAQNKDMRTYRSDFFQTVIVKPGKGDLMPTAEMKRESITNRWAKERYYSG